MMGDAGGWVVRDDGVEWPSETEAEDELWLVPGAIRDAVEQRRPLLGHRYTLEPRPVVGHDWAIIDRALLVRALRRTLPRVAAGWDPSAAFDVLMAEFDRAMIRTGDDGPDLL